jgi:hypothetical protein
VKVAFRVKHEACASAVAAHQATPCKMPRRFRLGAALAGTAPHVPRILGTIVVAREGRGPVLSRLGGCHGLNQAATEGVGVASQLAAL